MSKDENKYLGNNQSETKVVATKEISKVTTNNELEKTINDKTEMTSNPSDAEKVEQTKEMMQVIGQ
jgi:hypothetical protein